MVEKQITYKQLRKANPELKFKYLDIDENYSDSIVNFIKDYKDEFDIKTLILRREFLSDKLLRLFAVWCAREALKLIKEPDQRSIDTCDIAEKYANGEVTLSKLSDASDVIWNALCKHVDTYTEFIAQAYIAAYNTVYSNSAYAASATSASALNALYAKSGRVNMNIFTKGINKQIDKLIEIFETGQCSMNVVLLRND